MTLSSDELEILAYLKSWNGKSIPMIEIARNAGSRQKFRENAQWANGLMSRLVEAKLIQVNDRGHYCIPTEEKKPAAKPALHHRAPKPKTAVIIGDNYFPAESQPEPAAAAADVPAEPEPPRWVSPQIQAILKQSKKFAGQKKG